VLTNDKRALIAVAGDKELCILPKLANRHGLITGATGTGKTVTLQNLAETFSQMGVPVFLADVKGDLSGISAKGQPKGKIAQRVEELGLPGRATSTRASRWRSGDVFGKEGHPLRTTVSAMGPLLLARLLNLNEVQSGVLTMAFRIADDQGLLLLDMKDLRSMLKFIADNREQFQDYGNISAASVGAIQRGLLRLEEEGGDAFFGEPALDIADLLQTDENGKGVVNILASDQLIIRRASIRRSSCGSSPSSSSASPKWAIPRNRSSSSSSTKRTCFSTMPSPCSSKRSNRSCASSARAASASIS
jgi:uncharacterized protein